MEINKENYYVDVKKTLQVIKNMDISISNLFFVWCGIEKIIVTIFKDTRCEYLITELKRNKNGKENIISCNDLTERSNISEILFFIEKNNILSDTFIKDKLLENEINLIFNSSEIRQRDTTKLENGINNYIIIDQFREFRNQHLGHKITEFEVDSKLSKIALVYKKISYFFLEWLSEKFVMDTEWYNNINNEITTYSADIQCFLDNILEDEKEIAKKIINDTIIKIKRPNSLEILDETYFQNCIISNKEQLKSDRIDYLTKFNIPETKMGMIVANKFNIPPRFPMQILCEDEGQERLLIEDFETDILKNINLSPVLYKVLSVGGAGKSTFIWHLAYTYYKKYPSFYIKKHDEDAVRYIFDCVKPNKEKPVIIFMDEFTRSDISSVVSFSQAISNPQITRDYKVILILAEREARFGKLDKDFYDGYKKIYTHIYSNNNIEEQIFDKVFELLNDSELDVTNKLYSKSKNIYKSVISKSIVDKIFATIIFLKNDNTNVLNFKFDWDDWAEFCTVNNVEEYKEIFEQVAFFYQFGIEVPLNYICKYLYSDKTGREFDRKLNNLISFFESLSPNSSINYTISESGNTYFLKLRHERIGQWYFPFNNDNTLQKRIFNSFIKYIDEPSSFYLFKNLIRNNIDFENSEIYKELNKDNVIQIFDGYIKKNENNINEKVRGLIERHFYNYNIGKYDLSFNDINEIIILKDSITSDTMKSYLTTAYIRYGLLIEENRITFDEDSDDNWNKLKELYLDILKYDKYNLRALLKLHSLYFNHFHDEENFKNIHKRINDIVKEDISLAYGWISFIKNNFSNLPDIVIKSLHDFYKIDIRLIIEISNLFSKYKLYKESNVLNNHLFCNIDSINVESSLYFASQVADTILNRIYKMNANDENRNILINKADNLINKILNYKTDFRSDVLKAKIGFVNNKFNGDYESLLHSLFDKDNTKYVSMNLIHNYYSANIDKYMMNNIDYDKLGIYVNNYINFFINKYDTIELIYIGQKINDYIDFLICINGVVVKINDSNKIFKLHEIAIKYFKKIEYFFSSEKDSIDISHYNYLYSRFATIYFFHFNAIHQKKKLLENYLSDITILNEDNRIKSILDIAFQNDSQNVTLYIYVIQCYMIVGDKIDSLLENNIIYNLSNDQKSELLKKLWLNNGYEELAKIYTNKFGLIDSVKLKTKNNLLFSYIKAELWKYAISTLQINYINISDFVFSKELRNNICDLIDKININKNRKNPLDYIKIKYDLSNICLNFIDEIRNDVVNRNNILLTQYKLSVIFYNKFKMLFLLGEIKDAISFFNLNKESILMMYKKKYKINIENEINLNYIFKSWYVEYIECHSSKIINEVRYTQNFTYLLDESKTTILNLSKLTIPYSRILYSEVNNDVLPDYCEEIKNKFKLIFNNFLPINDSLQRNQKPRKINPKELYELYLMLLDKDNRLIDKCILTNLIKPLLNNVYKIKIDYNDIIINKLIERYENTSDTEIFRMIGRYLLSDNKFVDSIKYIESALKLAKDKKMDIQIVYCLNNLSECNLNYAKYEINNINIDINSVNIINDRIESSLATFYNAQLLNQKLNKDMNSSKFEKNKELFFKKYIEAKHTLVMSSLNMIIKLDFELFNRKHNMYFKLIKILNTINNENIQFAESNNINTDILKNKFNDVSVILYQKKIKPFKHKNGKK